MTKRGRPPLAEEVQQVAFKLPKSLVRDIDAYAEQARKELAGITITRSDAVRLLISKGLEAERNRLDASKKNKSTASRS